MNGKLKLSSSIGCLGLALALAPPHSLAAGFAILEQSAKRLGTAYAGGGAVANDVSSVWYNPAAAPRVGRAMQLGVHYISPQFDFSDPVALDQESPVPLFLSSRLDGEGGKDAVVPDFSYSALVADNWYAGITVNVPFGLATEYDDNWVGRYQTLDSEITSVNLNPFVAYQANDEFSVGFGLNLNYTEVRLSRAIDFAAACALLAGGLCPNGATPGSGQFDGAVETEGDDSGWGYNLGLLWSPTNETRVSVSYRSDIDLELTGDGDFDQPSALGGLAALPPAIGGSLSAVFADSDIEADLTLPDTFSVAVSQQLNLRTQLLADVTWTGWDSIQEISIGFENPLTPEAPEELGWENTLRYGLGLNYDYDERWTFRAGVAYDESPVPNALLRSPRLPDNDRIWFAVGGTWEISRNASLDVGYAHIFIDDTDILWEQPGVGLIAGEYDSSGDALSVAFSVGF